MSCSIIGFARFAGIEKPMPTLPPVGEKMAVLIPRTFPSKLNSGPPELPRLIEASVWIKLSYGPKFISLLKADIIPVVTVPPKPKGFPIAITE